MFQIFIYSVNISDVFIREYFSAYGFMWDCVSYHLEEICEPTSEDVTNLVNGRIDTLKRQYMMPYFNLFNGCGSMYGYEINLIIIVLLHWFPIESLCIQICL